MNTLGSRILAGVAMCLAAFVCMTGASAVDYLRPDDLRSGMKGYGLSVFKGTKPERFEVEIVGILKNVFPKQDMILIRMSGANLEKHKVIAGMSGSPIYIDGKLIGALAYGWAFENEPLAGVTPIHNMLAELDRKAAPSTAQLSSAISSATPNDLMAPRPLLTPLSLGGFSPAVIERLSGDFAKLGLLPVAAGGVADRAKGSGQKKISYEPGGAIGVALIRGDFNAVAVGTVTHVEGNRVLAFGHPFFGGGMTRVPAMVADVQTIMSSVARSFKLAVGFQELGSMVGDWQSCIVADTTETASMLPVSVDVENRTTSHREHYEMEVMRNPLATTQLVMAGIIQSIFTASGASDVTTVMQDIEAEVAGLKPGQPSRVIHLGDTSFSSAGDMIAPRPLGGLVSLFDTPFGRPVVERIRVKVTAVQERRTAEIKRAYFSEAELVAGTTAPLTVVLKPFGQEEVTRVIDVAVPLDSNQQKELTVVVMDGASAPLDVAPPENIEDYLDIVEKQRRSTDLVVLCPTQTLGMRYRGKVLPNLPASFMSVLIDGSAPDVAKAVDMQQVVVPTDWVLDGRVVVKVSVKEDATWENGE